MAHLDRSRHVLLVFLDTEHKVELSPPSQPPESKGEAHGKNNLAWIYFSCFAMVLTVVPLPTDI